MAKLIVLLIVLAAAALVVVAMRPPEQAHTDRATVLHVIDGDTLDVRIGAGSSVRVRLLGIDTPELGECFFVRATTAARRFADGRAITLRRDPTQPARDRFGRTLAYVELSDGTDLGERMIVGGFARTFVVGRPFERVETYRRAETAARRLPRSIWRCPA